VVKFLRGPDLLYQDPDLVANVPADARRDLYFTLRLLKVPRVTRLLMRQDRAMERWESWYEHSLANTRKLHQAGVRLIFGTDTPFAFGNFFHSVMNEVRALKLSGLSNESILRMATSEAASVLGLSDRIGTIAPGKVADVVLVDGDPLSADRARPAESLNLVAATGRARNFKRVRDI
jgi:imidazolonepropionase-like amidohydrolase